MRDLILGTAGHIDHGKTSLVRVLTGIDCDRLPEEKARGMTIDIGFAHLDLGAFRLGIVDVPGHERFIRNMLAGATGIDLCLLVVAADDAVMPQTHEHLDILRLLDLRCGVVALTKTDLVDETLLELAEDDVRSLVAGTFLADAPIVRVSARTGMGLDALRAALAAECAQVTARDELDLFRMAIDRAFVVQGRGTIVTGTVASGRCRVGDEVVWLPRGDLVRIRGAQSHGITVDEAHRGMRAAFNVAGVKHEDVLRGHELATPNFLVPSRTLTIDLRLLADSPQPLKHRTPVRVHIGAAEIMGTVSLLDAARLPPGESGLAQIMLAEPYPAAWGQPLVLREASANWTYGGGRVLQPVARPIRRRKPEMLTALASLAAADAAERMLTAVRFASLGGVEFAALPSTIGASSDAANELAARLVAEGKLEQLALARGRRVLVHSERIEAALRRAMHVVRLAHEAAPWQRYLDRGQAESQIAPHAPPEVARMLIERLLATGQLVGDARRLAGADHVARLTPAQQELKDSIAAAYLLAALQRRVPVSDLEKQAGPHGAFVAPLIQSLVEEGMLVHIEQDLFISTEAERRLRDVAASQLRVGLGYRLGEIRELLDSVRQLTLPLCGHLERLGVLRREGDLRFVIGAAPTTAKSPTSIAMDADPGDEPKAIDAVRP